MALGTTTTFPAPPAWASALRRAARELAMTPAGIRMAQRPQPGLSSISNWKSFRKAPKERAPTIRAEAAA